MESVLAKIIFILILFASLTLGWSMEWSYDSICYSVPPGLYSHPRYIGQLVSYWIVRLCVGCCYACYSCGVTSWTWDPPSESLSKSSSMEDVDPVEVELHEQLEPLQLQSLSLSLSLLITACMITDLDVSPGTADIGGFRLSSSFSFFAGGSPEPFFLGGDIFRTS